VTALIPIRDENPYHRFPVVTVGLIAANVVVFFAMGAALISGTSDVSIYRYGAVPCDVLRNCPALPPSLQLALASRSPLYSIFSSMFVHANILHLGFNMLFLWVFGNNVEDRLGPIRFVVFYFVTGVAAAFTHIVFNAHSVVPVVGASGAISGVLGAYIVLWPQATVVSLLPLGIFFWPIRTPAWVVLGLWFLVQILSGLASLGTRVGQQTTGVAFFAHVGGFVFGALTVLLLVQRRPLQPRY
jgi:membrane associated rhomboid family serine protease